MYGQMLCNAIEFKLNLAPLVKEEDVYTLIKKNNSKKKIKVFSHFNNFVFILLFFLIS